MERLEIGREIVPMRHWPDGEQPVRAMLLTCYMVDLFDKPESFKHWLTLPRKDLDGRSLFNLVQQNEWRVYANYLDDALTGQPS
jgi:hypothetical protein